MRGAVITAAGAVAIGAVAAACSSGMSTSSSMPRHPSASSPAASGSVIHATVVELHALPGLGPKALVGAGGRTLYLFEGDKNGKPSCLGACATAWPPYLAAAAPQARSGVNPALLGTVHRSDGTTQVTYNTDCCGFSVQFRRFALIGRNDNQFRVAFALSNIGSFGTLKRQEKIF